MEDIESEEEAEEKDIGDVEREPLLPSPSNIIRSTPSAARSAPFICTKFLRLCQNSSVVIIARSPITKSWYS